MREGICAAFGMIANCCLHYPSSAADISFQGCGEETWILADTVNAEIFVGGTNFRGQASPQKLNPREFAHSKN